MATLLPSEQTTAQKKALTKFLGTGGVTARTYRNDYDDREWSEETYRLDGGKCWRSLTDYRQTVDNWQEVPFSAAVDAIAQLAADGWSMSHPRDKS